jgi:ethanolamine utilization protein EutQ (cupin superfamily)
MASLESGSNGTVILLDHRMQYIVDGEIHLTDGTGKTMVGKAGDLFWLPHGSQVTYYTPKSATTYVVIADKVLPITPTQLGTLQPVDYQKQVDESARNTPISHFPNLKDRKSKRFQEYSNGLSPETSSAFFDEVGCFKWTGKELPSGKFPSWNMCAGIFYLKAGPPFTSYKYEHHYQIDLMLDGELHYDGQSGQDIALKQGDLVHNPRQSDWDIKAPDFGKFLTVSLSDVDDFWR